MNPRESVHGYLAELRYLDSYIGELLEILQEALPAPTYVMITSDHGEEFGEHGEQGHGHSLYREVLWIPVIVNLAEDQFRLLEARLEARDFFDLTLDLSTSANLDVARWAESRARDQRYASVYLTTNMALHRPYLREVCMRGIEKGEYRLIWSGYGSTYELYRVGADPIERFNLAGKHLDILAELRNAMDAVVPRWSNRVPVERSDEVEQMMRRLGYIR